MVQTGAAHFGDGGFRLSGSFRDYRDKISYSLLICASIVLVLGASY